MDSVVCEYFVLIGVNGIVLDLKWLGVWDCEVIGDIMVIVGKKMYVFFCEGENIKKVFKGVKLIVV